MLRLLLAAWIACAATPSLATTVNGEFNDGLNGWTVEGLDSTGYSAINPFLASASGTADPFAKLITPFASSGFLAERIIQTVSITALNYILRYDLDLVSTANDPSNPNGSGKGDLLLSGLRTSTDEFFISRVRAFDGLTEALGQPLSGTGLITQVGAINSNFSYGVEVDLSSYIGTSLDIFFTAALTADGKITTFGVDNVALIGSAIPAVPLPSSILLLGFALPGLWSLKRRKT